MTTREQDAQTIANLTESLSVLHAYIEQLEQSAEKPFMASIRNLRNANWKLTQEQADLKDQNMKLRAVVHSLQDRVKAKSAI